MRWTWAAGVLLAAAFGLPRAASAAPVMVTASYQENFLGNGGGDLYTITNAGSSAAGILTVRYDLSASRAFFDPADSPFTAVSGASATSFSGMFDATRRTLTLSFSDFDPGESFSFRVDTDDRLGFTLGFDFEDAILRIAFDSNPSVSAMAAFRSNDLRRLGSAVAVVRADVNASVAEPGTAGLLLLGLAGLGWKRRRRAA